MKNGVNFGMTSLSRGVNRQTVEANTTLQKRLELEEHVAKKFLSLKESSRSRGIEFGLPMQSLMNLFRAKKCYYSGVPIDDDTRSLDRIDNEVGYVIGNVVATHSLVNQRKGDLTLEEMLIFGKVAEKIMKKGRLV